MKADYGVEKVLGVPEKKFDDKSMSEAGVEHHMYFARKGLEELYLMAGQKPVVDCFF